MSTGKSSWIKHIDFMILDVICLIMAYGFAYLLRFSSFGLIKDSVHFSILFIYILALIVELLLLNALSDVLRRGYLIELIKVFEQTALTVAIVTLILYAGHIGNTISRILVFLAAAFYVIIDYIFRILWKRHLRAYQGRKTPKHRNLKTAFCVTDFKHFKELSYDFNGTVWNDYRICGVCFSDGYAVREGKCYGVPVINGLDEAARLICRCWVDEVFIFSPGYSSELSVFISRCREMGMTLHIMLNLETADTSRQFIENIGGYSAVTTAFSYMSPRQRVFKRFCDIIFSLIGCIVTVLIGIVIGPIIYIKSPGPIIFKQRRVGRNGKLFNVYKFRSMYLDAEERKKELITDNRISDGRMFKLDFDPRIIGNRILRDGTKKTGIGEFIRKTSLDEFPQFFNVLKGDMSIVGTRPPTIDEWEKYEYHHRARLAIKPGITGLWQVSGRSEITDFEQVVKLDTEYITHYRIALDIKIFLKTIVVLVKRKGAM